MPTNESVPTNGPPTIDKKHPNWQTKGGWIEWTKRETKTMGTRRYPRRRKWRWDEEKEDWVKTTPKYSLNDYDPVDEEDYVKIVERRERAKKLGF